MPERLPFSYRTLVAFTVPLMIWVLVSVAAILSQHQARVSDRAAAHSERIIDLASAYRNIIDDMRTYERAFLVTSYDAALESHKASLARANGIYEELRKMSADRRDQLERLSRAGNYLQEWFYEVSMARVEQRLKLPVTEVWNADVAEHFLLEILSSNDTNAYQENSEQLASALRSLRSLPNTGVNTTAFHSALLSAAAAEREAAQGNTASAADRLRAIARELAPLLWQIGSGDYAVYESIMRGDGPRLVTAFQDELDNFIDAERSRLEDAKAKEQRAIDFMRWVIWSGLALGMLSMIITVSWFGRRLGVSVRSIENAAAEIAHGNFSARAVGRGRDDRLTMRFNLMVDLIEKRQHQTECLSELIEALHNSISSSEALAVFGQFASRLFPDNGGVLYLIDANGVDVHSVASWHGGEKYSEQNMLRPDCWGLRLGRLHENDADGSARCNHIRDYSGESLCCPLPAFGEIIGLLFITVSPAVHERERRHERQFVETVAEQVALALANVRLREKLRSQSIRDPLTQIYNRRHLDEEFDRELQRSIRDGSPLAVLAIDIDHFKEYNDEHGHDAGDAVLVRIGELLRDGFRTVDTAFRLGGEEFAVLLPGTSRNDAVLRAEELRRRAEHTKVALGNLLLPSITLSIGVAVFPEHGSTEEQLLKSADQALYRAKDAGRNCVVSAESPQIEE